MLRFSEMADDEGMNSLPGTVGKKQHGQAGHSEKHDNGLILENLGSTETPHNLRKDADDEEISADDQHGQGRPKDRRRRIHIDLGQSGSCVGQRQDEAPDEERTRLDAPQRDVGRGEENRLAPNVKTGTEDHRKGHDHELDPPAHRSDGRSKRLFQVRQDQDERNEEDDVQRLGHRARLQPPEVARRRWRPQLFEEAERHTDRQQTQECQRDFPAGHELAVITPRVRQAEAQPYHGYEGLGDECRRQPLDHLADLSGAQAEAREYAIKPESRHPREEAPSSGGRLPAEQADHGQEQAEQPSRERENEKKGHCCSWRRSHAMNTISGTRDSTKKKGPPRR